MKIRIQYKKVYESRGSSVGENNTRGQLHQTFFNKQKVAGTQKKLLFNFTNN